jgi:hypothetical protein
MPCARVEVRPRLIEHPPSRIHRLVDQGAQTQRLALAGAQDLAVLAQDVADLDVDDLDVIGQPAGHPSGGKDHLEVQRLRRPDDVEHAVGSEVLNPVPDRREIRCGVTISTIGLADDERHGLALAAGELRQEDAQGSVRDGRNALGLKLGTHPRQRVVVGRLASEVGVGQRDVQRRIDAVEIVLGQVDEIGPQPHRLGVALLQGQRPGPRPRHHLGVRLGGVTRRLIERVGVSLHQPSGLRALAHRQQVLDEHAEVGAPVADVVLPNDVVPQVFQRPGKRVPDHGGPQVPDVHLLGNVGRGVVQDDDPLLLGRDPEARVVRDRPDSGGDPRVGQREVDEPRPAHVNPAAHPRQVELGHHP